MTGRIVYTSGGRLAENIMHFARLLRAAGLPIGTGRVLDGLRALDAVNVSDRDEFYWALHAVFVSRRAHHEVFDQAFALFFRPQRRHEEALAMLASKVEAGELPPRRDGVSRRVADAMAPPRTHAPVREREVLEVELILSYSPDELLKEKDFEEMSAEEVIQVKEAMANLRLPVPEVATRRFRPHARGSRIDMRATLRAGLRTGGWGDLRRRIRVRRPPPLVVLCDVSGSMGQYSRMLLHFLHALSNDRSRVHTFVFGTRLTNISRYLRHRDVDVAVSRVSQAVEDWEGGTRIGESLAHFNLRWSRRVLGQGAVVLLITDGLDRDAGRGLAREMDRLHRSCRRLIWLNPLLRYVGFEPRAQGIQAMLAHVDDFRPVHNLKSLAELVAALRAG